MALDIDKDKIENYKSTLGKRYLSYEELLEAMALLYFLTNKATEMATSLMVERDRLRRMIELYEQTVALNEKEKDIYKKGFDKSLQIHKESFQIHEELKKIKSEQFALTREKGTLANKVKAAANIEFILNTNSELLKSPDWARKTIDQRANYIARQCITLRKKMNNGKEYSEGYIKKLITGK